MSPKHCVYYSYTIGTHSRMNELSSTYGLSLLTEHVWIKPLFILFNSDLYHHFFFFFYLVSRTFYTAVAVTFPAANVIIVVSATTTSVHSDLPHHVRRRLLRFSFPAIYSVTITFSKWYDCVCLFPFSLWVLPFYSKRLVNNEAERKT